MIITIDGPAGVGKSTAARELAEALGIAHLDTGATYRAVTLKALRCGVDMQNESALAKIAGGAQIHLITDDSPLRVLLDGQDVSESIRSQEVSDSSHLIARSPAVRNVLVQLQRAIGARLGDFVAEGRDQGSVVFPQADVKFYLDASPEVRATRRCQEMQGRGEDADYRQVLRAIIDRDERDRSRPVAPLVRPAGAIVIDTSDMNIEQVTAELLKHVEAGR